MYNRHATSSRVRTVQQRGFTLVETLVAVGLFAIVTTVASSAFLAMVNADRVSRSLRIATDNLSLSLEDMSRRIKTGTVYVCIPDPAILSPGVSGTADCAAAVSAPSMAFNDQDGVRFFYKRGEGPGSPIATPAGCGDVLYATNNAGVITNKGCILRQSVSILGLVPWTPTTSHEIDIKTLKFVVGGSSSADAIQPYVIILVEGEIGVAPKPTTKFKMQTMVTQRQLDI